MKVCPKCKKQLRDEAKFCNHCGMKMDMDLCSRCGKPINSYSKFCKSCGAPINAKAGTKSLEQELLKQTVASTEAIPIRENNYVVNQVQPTVLVSSVDQNQLTQEHSIKEELDRIYAEGSQKQSKKKHKKKHKKKGIILGFVEIAIIAAIAYFFLTSSIFHKTRAIHDSYLYIKNDALYYYNVAEQKSSEVTTEIFDCEEDTDLVEKYIGLCMLSHNGDIAIYPDKITDTYTDCGDLYFKKMNKSDQEAKKIDSQINKYTLSEDDTILTYRTSNDNALYQYHMKKDTKDKIDDEVEAFVVSDDGKTIEYVKDKELYIRYEGKDKEKIDNDITFVNFTVKDFSSIFYMKKGSVYRKSIGKEKEKIASDVYEIIQSYDTGEFYYLKRDPEDKDKNGIDVDHGTLCYFDGTDEQIIMDHVQRDGTLVTCPERQVIAFRSPTETSDHNYEVYVAFGKEKEKIRYNKSCAAVGFYDHGSMFYYLDDFEEDEFDGMLYEIDVFDNGLGETECSRQRVNRYTLDPLGTDIIYFKNIDYDTFCGDMGVFYMDIDENVLIYNIYGYDNLLTYITDWDPSEETGDLRQFKDREIQLIHKGVYDYRLRADGVITFSTNLEQTNRTTDLYIYQNNESIKIDKNVSNYMHLGDNKYGSIVNEGDIFYFGE